MNLILIFSNLSPLPAICLGYRSRTVLWFYSWICLISDVIGFAFKTHEVAIIWHVNLFFLFEFEAISLFLSYKVFGRAGRKISILGATLFAGYFVLSTLTKQPIRANFVGGAILYGVLIVLCIAALYTVIRDIEYVKVERSPLFIFSASFLLYASGSIMLFLFKEYLDMKHHQLIIQLWYILRILNTIKNVSIAYIFTLQKNNIGFGTA